MRHSCVKVTLRQKPISKGRFSLYLDFYPEIRNPRTNKMTRREFLGMYILANPTTPVEKAFNDQMMDRARAICCKRQLQVINAEFGFLDVDILNADFLEFFRETCRTKYQKWDIVYRHFEKFVGGKCKMGDINVDLCNKFRDYLLNANKLARPNQKVTRSSASGYFSTFRALLAIAYKEKLIRENVNDFLESIKYSKPRREFLTLKEVKKLAKTPCAIPVLKRASLFSILTGLRISDVLNLTWENIVEDAFGGYSIRLCTQKTQTEATLPLSKDALLQCGERSEGTVFVGLKRSMINYPLKDWIKQAGIKKKITFHCFRHTYATLQLAAGTDIFTVKNLLTHANIGTTELYSHIIDSKKQESINAFSIYDEK